MLRCTAMGGSARSYYTHLHSEDYYLRLDGERGVWTGRGAERLGLSGEVDEKEFSRLFLGFDPKQEGRKLVQNAGRTEDYQSPDGKKSKGGRQPGWDVTMSAPKSLSALYAMSSEAERAWIRGELISASKEAISYLEEATVTRTGQGGKGREKTGLVSGLFLHTTARAVGESMPDPQLHVHGVVFNVGVSPAEQARDDSRRPKTRSITSKQLFDLQREADSVFMLELSRRVSKRYELEQGVHAWEVKGVPRSLCEAFSKRSQEVEAVAPRGSPAWEREQAALKTRAKKDPKLSRASIEAEWTAEGREHRFTHERAAALIQRSERPKQSRETELEAALAVIGGAFFAKRELFAEREFLKHAYAEGARVGFGKSEVLPRAKAYLGRNAEHLGTTHYGSFWMRETSDPRDAIRARRYVATLEEREVHDRKLLAAEVRRLERKGHRVLGTTWSNAEREALARSVSRHVPEELSHHIRDTLREKLSGRDVQVHTVSRLLVGLEGEASVPKARRKSHREKYGIDDRTVVVLPGERGKPGKASRLAEEVERRGGRVVFAEEVLRRLRAEEKERVEAKQEEPSSRLSEELARIRRDAEMKRELEAARREALAQVRERMRPPPAREKEQVKTRELIRERTRTREHD